MLYSTSKLFFKYVYFLSTPLFKRKYENQPTFVDVSIQKIMLLFIGLLCIFLLIGQRASIFTRPTITTPVVTLTAAPPPKKCHLNVTATNSTHLPVIISKVTVLFFLDGKCWLWILSFLQQNFSFFAMDLFFRILFSMNTSSEKRFVFFFVVGTVSPQNLKLFLVKDNSIETILYLFEFLKLFFWNKLNTAGVSGAEGAVRGAKHICSTPATPAKYCSEK